MNLNLEFFGIKITSVLLIIILTLIFFMILFLLVKKLSIEKRIRDRKISPRKVSKNELQKHKNTWFNNIISKLDREYIEMKLIHAGNPLGLSDIPTYIILKALFTFTGIIIGLQLYSNDYVSRSVFIFIFSCILGFFLVDIFINQSTKSRVSKINSQLPNFLVYFDNYNKAGLMFEDILSTTIDILEGELKKEVIRFNVNYSMTKDFELSLREFTKRLGSADSDSLEIKLRQCYYSGVYDDVISDEKEMIDKKIVNDIAKQTKQFDLYLAIAMGLLLFNLFLWLIYPLMIMVTRDMGGMY